MCQYCRDLSPADCPGCISDLAPNEETIAAMQELETAVHDETFRDIGEPTWD